MTTATELHVVEGSRTEVPYRFEVLEPSSLFIDESYQRPLSRFVKEILDNFKPTLVGCLFVSQRQGRGRKRYAVIDGQTRLVALRQLGHTRVPCLVYEGLDRPTEAGLFADFQTERRAMRAYHRFRAAVVARNPEALAIQKTVKATGFELSDTAGVDTIAAVNALEAAYRRGPEILERTLLILYEAWARRKHAATGEAIRGLAYYLYLEGDHVDDDKLARRLSIIEPPELSRRASAARSVGGHGGNSPRYMAEAIRAIYHSRSQAARATDR